jgi:hypothetical protein
MDTPADAPSPDDRQSGDVLRFWLPLAGMVALLVLLPVAATAAFDLDPRTPDNIAQDALHDNYGLVAVDAEGDPVPDDSSASVSEFSLEAGATTEDVPFRRHGRKVSCAIHVPNDDPASVTASCTGAR